MEIKDLPQIEEATESDHVVSSISQKTRLISFKNILEKISFSSLVTTAKNIIGSINELKGRCDTLDTSVSKLNTDINKAGSLILLASSSEAKWVGKAVTKSISNFKSICFILKDSNNSISSQTEIPVDVYKTCNSGSKTVCIIKRSDVESYSYYSNDNTIGLYVSASGYTVEAYGRY